MEAWALERRLGIEMMYLPIVDVSRFFVCIK